MQNFNEVKESIIAVAKQAGICSQGYTQLKEAKSFKDLCNVAKGAFEWCVESKVLTPEFIQAHLKECNAEGIFLNQDVTAGYCLVTSFSEIRADEHSFVYVMENGIVDAHDSTYVIATDNAEVTAYDFAHVKAKGNSGVIANDFVTVLASESAKVDALFHSYVIYSDNVEVTQYDHSMVVKGKLFEK